MGRILIVDDDETICNVIRDALISEGFAAQTATSASAAVHTSPLPSLVILDLNLAEYPGELIVDALSRVGGRHVPIVAISADTHAHERLRGRPGVVALLTKPFDLDQLICICRALLPSGQSSPGGTYPRTDSRDPSSRFRDSS